VYLVVAVTVQQFQIIQAGIAMISILVMYLDEII
jgi:hypothetical protein